MGKFSFSVGGVSSVFTRVIFVGLLTTPIISVHANDELDQNCTLQSRPGYHKVGSKGVTLVRCQRYNDPVYLPDSAIVSSLRMEVTYTRLGALSKTIMVTVSPSYPISEYFRTHQDSEGMTKRAANEIKDAIRAETGLNTSNTILRILRTAPGPFEIPGKTPLYADSAPKGKPSQGPVDRIATPDHTTIPYWIGMFLSQKNELTALWTKIQATGTAKVGEKTSEATRAAMIADFEKKFLAANSPEMLQLMKDTFTDTFKSGSGK